MSSLKFPAHDPTSARYLRTSPGLEKSYAPQNPDIYAWITVPGTGIDYPVLQKGDAADPYDDYYLLKFPAHDPTSARYLRTSPGLEKSYAQGSSSSQ